MANGDPQYNKRARNVLIPALKELSSISCKMDWKTLRDVKFALDIASAHVKKDLDIRAEQGIGGLKGQLIKAGLIPKQSK